MRHLSSKPVKPVLDPRLGGLEDDASSTKRRSLLALAGTLLSEITLPKLAVAWTLLVVGPALVLGLSPLVASAWVSKVTREASLRRLLINQPPQRQPCSRVELLERERALLTDVRRLKSFFYERQIFVLAQRAVIVRVGSSELLPAQT